jgi:nucleotide-binding universal stress UspA family protein
LVLAGRPAPEPSTLACTPAGGDARAMERARIVVGVDGSTTSREALRWAACLGEVLGAEVVTIHAIGLLEGAHDCDTSADSWRAGLRDLVERTWCAPLVRAPGAHRIEIHDGHPVDVLLAAADREDATLLVVGSRGRTPHWRWARRACACCRRRRCRCWYFPTAPRVGPRPTGSTCTTSQGARSFRGLARRPRTGGRPRRDARGVAERARDLRVRAALPVGAVDRGQERGRSTPSRGR